MDKLKIFVFFVFFVCSCSNEFSEKTIEINGYEYVINNDIDSVYVNTKGGKIKSVLSFFSKNDSIILCSFFDDGVIKERCSFKSLKLHGETIKYTKNGYVSEVSNWKNGNKNGIWEIYDTLGFLKNHKFFKNDTLIFEKEFKPGLITSNGSRYMLETRVENDSLEIKFESYFSKYSPITFVYGKTEIDSTNFIKFGVRNLDVRLKHNDKYKIYIIEHDLIKREYGVFEHKPREEL